MDNILSATDSYLALLLDAKVSAQTVLYAFFLVLARILPIMIMAPFLGSRILPALVKVMFGFCLCSIFLPQIILTLNTEITMFSFIWLALKELAIGFVFGLFVTVPFYIAQSSGSLIDHVRGSASLQVTDPTTSSQTGPLGILYNYVLIAVFFFVNGPFVFFSVLNQSFFIIPVDHLLNPDFFHLQLPFWKFSLSILNYLMSMAIQLAAPSFIGVLMAEMFLGIANRLAPQVQIVFLGISLKSWVGLGLLAAAWYFIMTQLGKESLSWIKAINDTLRQIPRT